MTQTTTMITEWERRAVAAYWLIDELKREIETRESDFMGRGDVLDMLRAITDKLEGKRVQLDAAPK